MIFEDKVLMQDVKPFIEYRDVVIAKVGNQDYLESELLKDGSLNKIVKVKRGIHDVSLSVKTMDNIPITVNHPQNFLDYKKPSVKIIGFIKSAKFEDGLVKANLFFFTSPPHNQFSLGYESNIVKTEDGYKMTNIRVNHLANLVSSRCGIICSLNKNKKVKDMATVVINDESFEVEDKVSAYIDTIEQSNSNIEEVKQQAFKDGQAFATEKTELEKLAKKHSVEFNDGDKLLDVKRNIVDRLGISTDGKSEEYLTAVIDTHRTINIEPQSITKTQTSSKYDEYIIGGE